MSARDAIVALVHAYAERIDAGDLEGVAELFAHGTFRAARGPARRGAVELLDVLRRVVILHDDGTPRTKHVVSNLSVAVDDTGRTATARSYFTVLQATVTLPLQVVVAGRYEDRFACVDGTWRYTERVVHMDLLGNLSQHVRREG